MTDWGEAGPPEDAYGRVTDAARFAPLHPYARDLLDELARRYAVTVETSSELDPNGRGPVPMVRLTPAEPAASPLSVTFTEFPGLRLRLGVAVDVVLPGCGCDACAETVEESVEMLREYVEALTTGRFGERLVRREYGDWWHEVWYGTDLGVNNGGATVGGDELATLRAALPTGEVTWAPWPRR
jgi:uncharacterized protein DUF6226